MIYKLFTTNTNFISKKEKYRGRELSKPVLIDLLKGGIIHG